MCRLRGTQYQNLMLIAAETTTTTALMIINLFVTNLGTMCQKTSAVGTNIIFPPTAQPWSARKMTPEHPNGYEFTRAKL